MNDPKQTASRPPLWPAIVIAFAIMGLYFAIGPQYLSWGAIRCQLAVWQDYVRTNPVLSALVFIALYSLTTALCFPTAGMLTLTGGAIFGPWLGVPIVLTGALIGSMLAFLLSRYLLRDAILSRLGPRARAIQTGIDRDGAYYLFSIRLVAAFPFFLVNLGAGLTTIPLRTYLVVSAIGMIPGTLIYVSAGSTIAHLEKPADLIGLPTIILMSVVGLMPLVIRRILNRPGAKRFLNSVFGGNGVGEFQPQTGAIGDDQLPINELRPTSEDVREPIDILRDPPVDHPGR